MKTLKIVEFIYAQPLSPTSEILVRAIQQTKDEFLDYLFNETLNSTDYLRYCHHLAGLDFKKNDPEMLFDAIKSNRENILKEFNALFGK
jgi:hypothetical protein